MQWLPHLELRWNQHPARGLILTVVPILLLSTAIHVGRKAVSCEADANQMLLITKDIVAGQSRAPMGCFRPLVCC